MDPAKFSIIADEFVAMFPPDDALVGGAAGRPASWMAKRHRLPVIALALGYRRTSLLERFFNIVDARSGEDTDGWDLRQKRRWVKDNSESLPREKADLFLHESQPSGRRSREQAISAAWGVLTGEFDWGAVGPWGPGKWPVGQIWRLERLQLLYIVTESVARAEGDHVAQAFLLGRNRYLGTSPLAAISDDGRDATSSVLSAVELLFRNRYSHLVPQPQ